MPFLCLENILKKNNLLKIGDGFLGKWEEVKPAGLCVGLMYPSCYLEDLHASNIDPFLLKLNCSGVLWQSQVSSLSNFER